MLYLGWFDGNPATLHELPPVTASEKYVEFMGGADAVLEKARASYDAGDYRWVAQVVHHVVFADPDNQAARDLEGDALEQLGYQAESGPWRTSTSAARWSFATAWPSCRRPNTASPDTIRAMSLGLFFDFLGVRLNAERAGDAAMTLNMDFGDQGGVYLIQLESGVLNNTAGVRADDADATVTLSRATLDKIMLGEETLDAAIAGGDATVDGDGAKLKELVSYLDTFPFWFNIVTP